MTSENKLLTALLILSSLYFTWHFGRWYEVNQAQTYRVRVNNVIAQSTECDLDDEPITSAHGLCFNGQSSEQLINLVSPEDQPSVITAIVNNRH